MVLLDYMPSTVYGLCAHGAGRRDQTPSNICAQHDGYVSTLQQKAPPAAGVYLQRGFPRVATTSLFEAFTVISTIPPPPFHAFGGIASASAETVEAERLFPRVL